MLVVLKETDYAPLKCFCCCFWPQEPKSHTTQALYNSLQRQPCCSVEDTHGSRRPGDGSDQGCFLWQIKALSSFKCSENLAHSHHRSTWPKADLPGGLLNRGPRFEYPIRHCLFFLAETAVSREWAESREWAAASFFLLAEGQTSREQPPPPQPKRDYIRHHYLRSATRQHPRPPQNSSVCTRFTTCSATPCPGMMHVGRMRSLLGGVNSTTLCPCI